MIFASKNVFNFWDSSRRDDLISLVYFLIYYLDESRLSFIKEYVKASKDEQFNIVRDRKATLGPKGLCGSSLKETRAHHLYPFA